MMQNRVQATSKIIWSRPAIKRSTQNNSEQ
jgi:hypothetical protein